MRPSPIRRAAVLVAATALALVAASCSGDDTADEAAGDDAPPEEAATEDASAVVEDATTGADDRDGEGAADGADGDAPELTATAPGVTAETITVGVSLLDMETLAANGFTENDWGDQSLVVDALVDAVNARGGIHGRRLEAVVDLYDPAGTAGAEETCVTLTQDNEVFAVIGGFLGPLAGTRDTCIVTDNETVLVGGEQTPEELEAAVAPWFTDITAQRRRAEILLTLLDQEGETDGARVFVVSNAEADANTDAELLPLLDERGIEVLGDATISADFVDQAAQDAEFATIAELIRAAEADTVLINGNPSAAVRGLGQTGLTDLDLWVVDVSGLANLGASVDRSLADGALAVTGLSEVETWEDPGIVACREVFEAAQPDVEIIDPRELEPGDSAWHNSIGSLCRWFSLFELIADAAGPELTAERFRAAGESLGEFSMPGAPLASLGPGKWDANDSFRLVRWDSTVSTDGELVPVTDIVDATP